MNSKIISSALLLANPAVDANVALASYAKHPQVRSLDNCMQTVTRDSDGNTRLLRSIRLDHGKTAENTEFPTGAVLACSVQNTASG